MVALEAIRDRRCEAGLTLVELMIGMFLSTIVVGGMMYFYTAQDVVYSTQMKDMVTTENTAAAMDFLQRRFQSAGSGFGQCPNARAMRWVGLSTGMEVSEFEAIRVYNDCNILTDPNSCAGAGNDGVDSFTIVSSQDTIAGSLTAAKLQVAFVSTATADANSRIVLLNNTSQQIKANDFLLFWEPGTNLPCVVLQAPPIGFPCIPDQPIPGQCQITLQANPLYNNTAENIFVTANNLVGGFGTNARVVRFGTNSLRKHFAIQDVGNIKRLVTWTSNYDENVADAATTNLEVIAEGIEDLQLTWSCDLNNDGIFFEGATEAERQNDEWAFNAPADTVPNCVAVNQKISRVRVTLISRANSPEIGNNSFFRPGAEDRPDGTAAQDLQETGSVGTFRRSVLTTEVSLPNMISVN